MIGEKTVQMSVWPEEQKFIVFVSNQIVNTGTFEPGEGNTYDCRGDAFDFTVTLDRDNTFVLRVPAVNGGNAVVMNNLGSTPVTFGPEQEDVEAP